MPKLNYADLQRMQLSVAPRTDVGLTTAQQNFARKKKISEDRKNQWPNTLEALRLQKELRMKERERTLELERQEVDKKEALLQKNERMKSIERANTLLYEQTDKMKSLRAQQLLSDVIKDREFQVEEKRSKQLKEKQRDQYYYSIQQRLIAEGDAKEEQEQQKRKEQNALIAAQQQEQLEIFKNEYIGRLRKEKAEGEEIKKKVEADQVKERENEQRRRREAKQAALDTKIANQQLQEIRDKLIKEEEKEEDRRKLEAKKKEALSKKRKDQEIRRFNEKLAIKQRMIDAATAQLVANELGNDQREAKQAQEARAAEDAEMEKRAERRRKAQDAIVRSRTAQLKMKQDRLKQKAADDLQMAAQYQLRNQQVAEEEQAEAFEVMARNVKVRKDQEKQAAEKQRIRMKNRAEELISHEEMIQTNKLEQARFERLAQAEFDEAKKAGKNVICIGRAVNAKETDLMAAGGTRV